MTLRTLTRLRLRLTQKDTTAMLFVTATTLNDEQREFLKANGVVLTDGVFDYEFPAFYEVADVEEVKQHLRDSLIQP